MVFTYYTHSYMFAFTGQIILVVYHSARSYASRLHTDLRVFAFVIGLDTLPPYFFQ